MTGYVPVIGDQVTATHLKAATPTAVGKVDHIAFDGSTVVVLDESNVRWWLPVKDYRIEPVSSIGDGPFLSPLGAI